MEQPPSNIIIQDLKKTGKIINKIINSKELQEFIFFLTRWMISTMISAIIISTYNIKTKIILKGWINTTLLLGATIVYIIGYVFHKTYELEKLNNKNETNTKTTQKK